MVAFNGGGALGAPSGLVTLGGGGSLQALGDASILNPLHLLLGAQGGFNTGGHNIILSGPITGPGGLEMRGGGTLTLTGANTFGSLDVQGGTVVFASQQALGAPGGQIILGNGAGLVAGSGMVISQMARP